VFRPIVASLAAIVAAITLLIALIIATNTITAYQDHFISEIEYPKPSTELNCKEKSEVPFSFLFPSTINCIEMEEDDFKRIKISPTSIFPKFSLSSTIRSTFSGSILTIRFVGGVRTWDYLTNQLNSSDRNFVEGSIGKFFEDIFGPDLSFKYQILPMLEKPSALHIGYSSPESLIFVLEGIIGRPKELDQILEILHKSFRSTIPNIRITERDLEGRFTARDVRISDNEVGEELMSADRWKIRKTFDRDDDSRVFITAQRGSSFAFSNNERALLEVIAQDESITPPSTPSMTTSLRIADGVIDFSQPVAASARSLLQLLSYSGTILWSLEQSGDVTILTIDQN